jgi:hypothetical protein
MALQAAASAGTAADAASKVGGLAGKADVIGAAGQVVGMAISTISTVSDANKRRKFEQNFQMLSLEQQKGLDTLMAQAKSQNERLSILGQYLTQLNSQRISSLANVYADREKQKRTTTILIVVGAFAIGIAAVYFAFRNK